MNIKKFFVLFGAVICAQATAFLGWVEYRVLQEVYDLVIHLRRGAEGYPFSGQLLELSLAILALLIVSAFLASFLGGTINLMKNYIDF